MVEVVLNLDELVEEAPWRPAVRRPMQVPLELHLEF
jgi:hypothetical protein